MSARFDPALDYAVIYTGRPDESHEQQVLPRAALLRALGARPRPDRHLRPPLKAAACINR